MKKRPGYAPLITNAHINRSIAAELFRSGFSVREIVELFPRVFKLSREEGQDRLGQRYTVELDDGRLELDLTITREAVDEAIASRELREEKVATGNWEN